MKLTSAIAFSLRAQNRTLGAGEKIIPAGQQFKFCHVQFADDTDVAMYVFEKLNDNTRFKFRESAVRRIFPSFQFFKNTDSYQTKG